MRHQVRSRHQRKMKIHHQTGRGRHKGGKKHYRAKHKPIYKGRTAVSQVKTIKNPDHVKPEEMTMPVSGEMGMLNLDTPTMVMLGIGIFVFVMYRYS